MSKTVLVTGGTGFIAGWCIVELLKRGYVVRTTVRSLSKEKAVRAAVTTMTDPGDHLTFFVADLTKDEGWDAAVAGCDYVLHVASPLGGNAPKDPSALIIPARDGTLRVLRAATAAGVKRVVFTSSVAASSPSRHSAYRQSKTLAERAAWDFMAQYSGPTTLTTILPTAVFGSVLTRDNLGSVQVIERLLNGRLLGNPRLGFTVVDVRDVADVHIRAMTAPEAAGQRFIAAGSFMWMSEMASTLRDKLGARAGKVPTRSLPDFVLRATAIFDPQIRMVTPGLGRKHIFNSMKAQRVLGWVPRAAATTIVECAESLLAR